MSKKTLVIWTSGEYADRLKAKLGADCVVTSEDELANVNFKAYSGIAVLVELGWGGKQLSDCYGITIARAFLRAKLKLRLPILFVSFLSPRLIRLERNRKEILDRQIVGAVGHDHLALPSTPRQWAGKLAEMQPLTDLQFTDVFNNFCNVKGLISESIHQLKNQCRNLFSKPGANPGRQMRALVMKAFDEIGGLLGETRAASAKSERLLDRLDFESADEGEVHSFLTDCEEKFKLLITEDDFGERALSTSASERQPWKVLLLDDEPDSLITLRNVLDARGVDCRIAQSVAEAESIIDDDIFNEIVVVISDYRLLERVEGIERHQRKQGYDFLFELAAQNRLAHLIALSGLSRKFLLESFQKYNTRVDVYSKQDLIDRGAINLFADSVVDRGMETYDALCSRPLVGEWQALKPFYAAHRQAGDYRQREAEINDRALRFIIQYQSLLESRDERELLMPGLEILENLTAKMKERTPQRNPDSIETFRNKLIARRIALWLHTVLGYDSKSILAALKGYLNPESYLQSLKLKDNSDDDAAKKTLRENIKPFLTTGLSLSFPNPAEHILVEEKHWLAAEFGVTDLYAQLAGGGQISYLVQIHVETFFEANPELLPKLKKVFRDVLPKSGKPVIAGMRAAKEVLKAIDQIVSTPRQREQRSMLYEVMEKSVRSRLAGRQKADEFLSWLRSELE